VSRYTKALGAVVDIVHVAPPNPDFIGYQVGPNHVRENVARRLRTEHRDTQKYGAELAADGIAVDHSLTVQGPTRQRRGIIARRCCQRLSDDENPVLRLAQRLVSGHDPTERVCIFLARRFAPSLGLFTGGGAGMIKIILIGDQIARSEGISATGPSPFLRLTNELLKRGVSPEQRLTRPSPPRQVRRLQRWNSLPLLHQRPCLYSSCPARMAHDPVPMTVGVIRPTKG
jgi:hypothetical protein